MPALIVEGRDTKEDSQTNLCAPCAAGQVGEVSLKRTLELDQQSMPKPLKDDWNNLYRLRVVAGGGKRCDPGTAHTDQRELRGNKETITHLTRFGERNPLEDLETAITCSFLKN